MRIELQHETPSPVSTELSLFIGGHKIKIDNVTKSAFPKCATLGPAGTYSEIAALELLQDQAEIGFIGRNREIIAAVKMGLFDLGIVASENSIEGNVEETSKTIINSELTILGEKILPIHQALLGVESAYAKKILNSHPQGIAQCGNWIHENLSDTQVVQHGSTAAAIQYAAEHEELAIGNPAAGKIYNIPVIQEGIEDRKGNTTRFWLIGRGETEPTGNDRTVIAFTLRNAPGTLIKVLSPFSDRGISINKVDTLPLTLDHYYFLMSVDGHITEPTLQEAIEEARESCWKIKTLGSFQKSLLPEIEYEPEAFQNNWVPKNN